MFMRLLLLMSLLGPGLAYAVITPHSHSPADSVSGVDCLRGMRRSMEEYILDGDSTGLEEFKNNLASLIGLSNIFVKFNGRTEAALGFEPHIWGHSLYERILEREDWYQGHRYYEYERVMEIRALVDDRINKENKWWNRNRDKNKTFTYLPLKCERMLYNAINEYYFSNRTGLFGLEGIKKCLRENADIQTVYCWDYLLAAMKGKCFDFSIHNYVKENLKCKNEDDAKRARRGEIAQLLLNYSEKSNNT